MAKRLPASPSARLVPGVKTQPQVQRGFEQLVQAIRPTLGPRPRHVVSQTMFQGQMSELLDNGAVIARRIVALPNRVEDVGAMYLREMLWKVYETAGDAQSPTVNLCWASVFTRPSVGEIVCTRAWLLPRVTSLSQPSPPWPASCQFAKT
jgi:hypothetical protein